MKILSEQILNIPPVRVVFDDDDIADISALIGRSLRSGKLTQGPLVKEFETDFSTWVGNHETVAVNSATSGLEIILRALGVAGKEVIVPANTFVATAAAALHAGASVKFADIELGTYALEPKSLLERISAKTTAVIIVHIGGIISDNIGIIRDICRQKNVFLVEDAAQALGSYYNNQSAGTFGEAGAFSFFPTKIITTGEGGMIVSSNQALRDQALILRNHGKNNHEECVALGHNWRMSEINAALGIVHLKKLATFLAVKRGIAKFYNSELAAFPGLRLTDVNSLNNQSYYKYIALLDPAIKKDKLKLYLKQRYNISLSGDVFPKPCPHLKVFRVKENFPQAEDFCRRHICLPIYPNMSLEEARFVVEALKDAIINS